MPAPRLLREQFATPLGDFLIVTDANDALHAANWSDRVHRMRLPAQPLSDRPSPSKARQTLEAYFAGDLDAIDCLTVETGGTTFQRLIWTALRAIPVGAPTTYRELARTVGRPAAIRAAGLANATNPVSVVIPCHRVIGSSGSLTGYGGGLERKAWLLAHEASAPV